MENLEIGLDSGISFDVINVASIPLFTVKDSFVFWFSSGYSVTCGTLIWLFWENSLL